MKLFFANQRKHGLTQTEVMVFVIMLFIVMLAFWIVVIAPVQAVAERTSKRMQCLSNLKEINRALLIWAGDHGSTYPMLFPRADGGGREFIDAGDIADCLRIVSNGLSSPKLLICPSDRDHAWATNFEDDFSNSHISYFISPNADRLRSQMIMSGDDNFATNGVPLKPGVVELSSQFLWTNQRHINVGNIGFADGSVAEVSDNGLEQAIVLSTNGTDVLVNRIAIP